jgi:hypothetical protein
MYASKASFLALALPVALLTACGDDGTEDTGAEGTTSASPTSTGEEPSTTGEEPNTTGGEPTSTGEEPTSTGDPDSSTGEPADMAMIRVMHLGVGAPDVDVFANGEGPVFAGLAFRNSTQYAEVPAGEYTFDVSAAGTPVDEAVITAGPLALEADTAYTAVAIGDLEQNDETGLQVIPLVDDAADIDAANVRITVVHAAPAVGEVDIWEITAEPVALLENVPYAASAGLPDIPAGPLEIGVDVDDDANPDVTFSVDASGLGGQQVNVYANNDADGNVALVAQLADGTVLTIPAN